MKSRFPKNLDADDSLFYRARQLRKISTEAENLLWQNVRGRAIGNAKFRRQHPILIYIVDFYCDRLKLVIEADGGIHNDPEVKAYDQERTRNLEANGITIIRFTNEQILNDTDEVLMEISRKIEEMKYG